MKKVKTSIKVKPIKKIKKSLKKVKTKIGKYKIEKNIPTPPPYRENGYRWAKVINDMKKGDSVFLSSRKEATLLYQALHSKKIKSATRKVKTGSKFGYRVWRSS